MDMQSVVTKPEVERGVWLIESNNSKPGWWVRGRRPGGCDVCRAGGISGDHRDTAR